MAVEDSKEADLRPVPLPVLVLGLQYVQDYADSVLIIFADNALVGVGSIGLNYAALLVGGFGYLMVLELECPRVKRHRVVPEEQSLDIHEGHVGRPIIIGSAITMCSFVRGWGGAVTASRDTGGDRKTAIHSGAS